MLHGVVTGLDLDPMLQPAAAVCSVAMFTDQTLRTDLASLERIIGIWQTLRVPTDMIAHAWRRNLRARPNLPFCVPLQLAAPELMVLYGEIGATVRADVAMAVMLFLRLSQVVFGRERKRLRRHRNGRRGVGLRFRCREWRRHGHRERLIGNNHKCAGHFRLYAIK